MIVSVRLSSSMNVHNVRRLGGLTRGMLGPDSGLGSEGLERLRLSALLSFMYRSVAAAQL